MAVCRDILSAQFGLHSRYASEASIATNPRSSTIGIP